ncbi:MAG: IPT/TIG domain-containing protein [Acidobacteriaceae bacterium]|nr:IPT/TIG domain-containing protein [Acidobacteriaceae bacterium]
MVHRKVGMLLSAVLLLSAHNVSAQLPIHKVQLPSGIVVSYFDDWYLAMRYRNGVEFWTPPAGAGTNRPLGKLIVTTEPAGSHADAVRRLSEIAGEVGEPIEVMALTGWPAISARRLAPPPRSDERAVIGNPNESLAVWITTAIAVGNIVLRADAAVAQSAGPALADQAAKIEQTISVPKRNTTEGLENELNQIRRQRQRAPAVRHRQTAIQPLMPQPTAPLPPSLTLRTQPVLLAQPRQSIEPEIAASTDGANIVVAAAGGISFSKDGGNSFMASAANGSVQNIPGGADGDLSVAYGKSGFFYISFIHFPLQMGGNSGPASVGVAVSTDSGQNFLFKSDAILCQPGSCSVDQPHIAADPFNAGPDGKDQVYVVWQNDGALACSKDGGSTWGAPVHLSSGSLVTPRLTVGRDGQVYVVFRSGDTLMLGKFSSCTDQLQGQPGFPKQLFTVNDKHMCPIPGLDRCNGGNRLSSHTVAVDDTNPQHVYLALANTSTTGNEDIIVFDSTDGGLTFPRQVILSGPTPAHRFMPWMCTTGGAAFVSWYDRSRATAAQPDLTDFLVAGASLQPGTLTAGTPVQLSGNADPQCNTGFPFGVDVTDNVSVSCVPPQFIGTCANSTQQCSATLTMACPSNESCTGCMPPQIMGRCVDLQHPGASSGQPCCSPTLPGSPVNGLQCPAGVSCNIPASGGPKYGDYNGNACAAGKVFVIWGSKTPPPGIDPAMVTQIRLFSATLLAGNGPTVSAVTPNQTPCGTATPVRIKGANFIDVQDVTLVDAGGVVDRYHLSFNVDTNTQISVRVPDTVASGAYDVIVYTPNGSSITAFDAPPLSRFLVPPIVNSITPVSGPATGGTEATISGSCFHSDMHVYFDSKEAGKGFNQCASSTQCTVFSPAAAKAGPVDVVASVGEARSAIPSPAQFSYIGPVITGISPSSGPTTGGTWVEISGSGFPSYDGITALNTPVTFDGEQVMAQCNLSACSVVTPHALRPGKVHVIATAFGVSSVPSSPDADVFTYNQFAKLTQFRLPDPFFGVEGGVFLDGNAPVGDALIALTSSDPSAVSLPPNVTIPAGAQFATVPLTFNPIPRVETVTLTATYQGSSANAALSLAASPPISLSIDATELDAGASAPATVTLNTPAPSTGAVVALASSDPSAIPVPPNLLITAGSQKGTFTVKDNYSGVPKKVTITATYSGASASDSLTVPSPPPPPDPCRNCRTPQQCCVCNGGTWSGGRCQ